MNARMHVPIIVSAMLVFFAACKKDIDAPEQEAITSEVSSNATANDVSETEPAVHTPVVTYVNANVAGFIQSVPARYNLTTKKYPLILFIHGIGELGTGVTRLNCCGLPRSLNRKEFPPEFVVNGQKFSFIVMSPQFKQRPSAADIQSVIDFAKKRFRIDETRIYVTGLSMGGGSTWDYSAVYGQNAAAIVPVCAGTKPTTALAKSVASKNLPIWSLNSSADAVVPVQWGKDWITWIDQYNPTYASKTKLTVWSDLSHNSTWWKAFDPLTKEGGISIYEWMLQHTRGGSSQPAPAPAPITSGKAPIAKVSEDLVIPLDWNYMPTVYGTSSTDPDGWIAAFSWSKVSGPSSFNINTPTAAKTKITNLVAGTYVFRLTVKDNDGNTSSADVKITMTGTGSGGSDGGSVSGAPIAKVSEDLVIPLDWNYMPTVYGTYSTDPDGWIASFAWSKVSGPSSYNIVSPNAGKTKITNLVAGTYVFRLTVKDNDGKSSTADVKITMTGTSGSGGSVSGAPIAKVSDDLVIPLDWNYMPTVYGTYSTDPDGWIAAFSWSKISGPSSYNINTPNAGKTKITNLVKGTYVFRLTVKDNDGKTSTADVKITMI